jgi:hypothetical protein
MRHFWIAYLALRYCGADNPPGLDGYPAHSHQSIPVERPRRLDRNCSFSGFRLELLFLAIGGRLLQARRGAAS